MEAPLFTTLSMDVTMNDNQFTYRFFIESCNTVWCYSQAVGLSDTTTVAAYQLEAGPWRISGLMNIQNLILVSL